MAMRWRFSSALAAALIVAACTQHVTRYYIPSAGNPRFTPAQAEDEISAFLAVGCAQRGDSALAKRDGGVEIALDVGGDGLVTRAELTRGSGDATLDGIFGAVAAQLALAPPTRVREQHRTADVRFACADSTGRPVHVELR